MSMALLSMLIILIFMAWLLLGTRSSFWDKIRIVLFIIFVYVCIRLMQGWSFEQILAPLLR